MQLIQITTSFSTPNFSCSDVGRVSSAARVICWWGGVCHAKAAVAKVPGRTKRRQRRKRSMPGMIESDDRYDRVQTECMELTGQYRTTRHQCGWTARRGNNNGIKGHAKPR